MKKQRIKIGQISRFNKELPCFVILSELKINYVANKNGYISTPMVREKQEKLSEMLMVEDVVEESKLVTDIFVIEEHEAF